MTKEKWLLELKASDFSMETYYDYYVHNIEDPIPFNDFINLFNMFRANHNEYNRHPTSNGTIYVHQSARRRIMDYYNAKFDIVEVIG